MRVQLRRGGLLFGALALIALQGCEEPLRRRLVIPDEMLRAPGPEAPSERASARTPREIAIANAKARARRAEEARTEGTGGGIQTAGDPAPSPRRVPEGEDREGAGGRRQGEPGDGASAAGARLTPDEPEASEAPQQEAAASPPSPPGRYVLRLAEGGRVWELELPDERGGYEVRVPLRGGGLAGPTPTRADEELFSGLDREGSAGSEGAPGDARGEVADARAPGARPVVDARGQAGKRSYLGGVARVNEMFRERRFELALIELVELQRSFPDDPRLFAMKGTLYVRLGEPERAREAWERALALDPDDADVAQALYELETERDFR